jgi:predicted GNAT superfamily acetyltransferase
VVADLARLRVTVFRDWPYLYDGDAAYERGYLARYARGDSIVVAAFDGDRMVGAATGMPLTTMPTISRRPSKGRAST